MEKGKTQVYGSIQSYWQRRTYRRLEGLPSAASKRKHVRVVGLGGGARRSNRRSWKVRPMLQMGVKALSPMRLLVRLRDAYEDAMLALSGGEARTSASRKGADFERRMMLHVYRTLIAPPEVIAY